MIFAGIGLSVFAGVVIGDGMSPICPLTIGLIVYLVLMLGAIRLWTHTLNRVLNAKTSLQDLASELNDCSDSYMMIDSNTVIAEFTAVEQRIDMSIFIHWC